jgi:hypothetical protein
MSLLFSIEEYYKKTGNLIGTNLGLYPGTSCSKPGHKNDHTCRRHLPHYCSSSLHMGTGSWKVTIAPKTGVQYNSYVPQLLSRWQNMGGLPWKREGCKYGWWIHRNTGNEPKNYRSLVRRQDSLRLFYVVNFCMSNADCVFWCWCQVEMVCVVDVSEVHF